MERNNDSLVALSAFSRLREHQVRKRSWMSSVRATPKGTPSAPYFQATRKLSQLARLKATSRCRASVCGGRVRRLKLPRS
ncbi:hypothetical protein D3C85_1566460 [compost metagenome]